MAKEAKKKVDLKKEKTTKKVRKESYFNGVRKEVKQVSWPKGNIVLKYTISTLVFILFVVGFFILLNIIMAAITGSAI